jgi:copper chaperone CopZ
VEVQKKIEKHVIPANIDELLASGSIVQLKQVDGSTECKINVQNEKPWRPKEKLHVAHFVLPHGYDKCAFLMETQGNVGDVVETRWASSRADDARIVVHVKTSRCLKAHDSTTACIHNVYGIKKR